MKIIGLSGKAGSGKDYIATNVLKPRGYHNWSLAWHFKVAIVGRQLATHEEVFRTKPPHVRRELQLEGTERGRNVFGENVWCRTMAEWMYLLNEQWGIDKWVVPDVRFPNEVSAIQDLGGYVYRIIAPQREQASGLSLEARQHVSETALDEFYNFDGYLFNDPDDEDGLRQLYDLLDATNASFVP